jgi:type I restriction enzyme, S subunit
MFASFDRQNSLDGRFLKQFLLSNGGQKQIDSFQAGGNRQGLNFEQVRSIKLPLPPTVDEQLGIAEALGDADALIDALEALITKKRDIKRGALQELLTGRRRLPGFSLDAGTFTRTELGPLPTDWSLSTVGAQFEVQLGKMLDENKNTGEQKPYIGNRAVRWGTIELSELPLMRISPTELGRYRLRRGDLLVCEGGEVGRSAIWNAPIEACYYQKALHRLRRRSDYAPELMTAYLEFWSQSDRFQNYVTQTSIAHLPKEKFITMPLPTPRPVEQRAIATVLADIDAEITALDDKLAKVRAVKQGMMQVLLTGDVRLV